MLKRNDKERPNAESLMQMILCSSGRHIYCGSCCSDDAELSDVGSFRGSETDEERAGQGR